VYRSTDEREHPNSFITYRFGSQKDARTRQLPKRAENGAAPAIFREVRKSDTHQFRGRGSQGGQTPTNSGGQTPTNSKEVRHRKSDTHQFPTNSEVGEVREVRGSQTPTNSQVGEVREVREVRKSDTHHRKSDTHH
jgi:hypothetical protein